MTTAQRLRNSRLAGNPLPTVQEAVGHLGAVQAQEYALTRWSLAQRVRNMTEADVDRALADASLIRTHVLRPTWHLVAREDARWLLALTAPRIQRQTARRRAELGLDAKALTAAEKKVAKALAGGRHLTRDALAAALGRPEGQRLPYLLMHCELQGLLCSGPLEGKAHTYALFDERVPPCAAKDRDEALVELVRRYLASHGPATVKDLGWWAGQTTTDLRKTLHGLGKEVRSRKVDGVELWETAASESPGRLRPVYLLPPYDELIVGYTESRFHGDPRAGVWKDRRLPPGLVLARGRLAGHWRRNGARLEAFLYEGVRGLAAAAGEMGRFLGLPLSTVVARCDFPHRP